ncbi:MAG: RNA polymerase sigma-70 factor [Pedobacter sp.]|nr:MAG: RNA polymerase sigma-70 factor [Pedobacter sp.]
MRETNNKFPLENVTDIGSFETIFKQHYAMLCARAWRFVQDKDIAEDIVQDVFYNLWKKRDELHIHTSIASYLHATTVNFALNYLKKRQSGSNRDNFFQSETYRETNSTEDYIFAKETNREIDLALSKLPEACRAVFVLSRFENLSYKAIALQLNISVKTVENQIGKALKIMRSELMAFAIYFILIFYFQ